ncbi:MAG: ATP-binding protein [Myxococcota bacterium]
MSAASPELAGLVRALRTQPLHVLMSKYTRLIEGLNARRPDKCAHLTFAEDSSEIAPNELARVDAALVHLLRNAFDHGIESQSVRGAEGKPRDGTIRCSLHHSGDSAVLSIADDGRGIDTQGLVEAAIRRGIWTREKAMGSTEDERLSLMFVDRLSTREEANELSGRGVGLPAVRAHMASIGGTLELHTQPGQGTTFTLTFPIGAASVNQGNAPSAEGSPERPLETGE